MIVKYWKQHKSPSTGGSLKKIVYPQNVYAAVENTEKFSCSRVFLSVWYDFIIMSVKWKI